MTRLVPCDDAVTSAAQYRLCMKWRAAVLAADPKPSVLEITLAAIITLIGSLQGLTGQLGPQLSVTIACAVGPGVAVLCARAFPLPAVALLCGITFVSGFAGIVPDDSIAHVVATIIVAYTVSAWAPVWSAVSATVGIIAAMVLSTAHSIGDVAWESVLMALPFIAGQAMRRHRLVLRRLETATAELERSREERAATALVQERLRVAREVHDVVAHSVSVMVVQASAAETTIQTNVADAITSLQAIQNTGRQALTELRGLVGVLRTDTGSSPPKSQGPRVQDLDALAERYCAAGLVVSIDRTIDVSDLGDGVELVIYRLVQESLTNALKHGGHGTASVIIERTDDAITVRIDNTVDAARPSPVAASAGSGHGIPGMRERVWSLGGSLTAIPTDGDGFRVSAVIPLTNGRG